MYLLQNKAFVVSETKFGGEKLLWDFAKRSDTYIEKLYLVDISTFRPPALSTKFN